MQDAVQAIGAGDGRIFSAVGVVGDRRLRPHSHHQQALKCPRCESLNTKFCYYNNYNLSQPRHFCKACRRYWTKGGVLRNVPVGGGCRKAKRSSSAKPKRDRVTEPTQQDSTTTTNKSSSSNTETSTQDKTASSVYDEASLLMRSAHDQPAESQQAMEGLAACMMMASSEDLMGFSDPTTSYGNEFKVVDYGDSTLFDLSAAVDPNYWNDQSTSLNFLP